VYSTLFAAIEFHVENTHSIANYKILNNYDALNTGQDG
jgi:hypothetical protein